VITRALRESVQSGITAHFARHPRLYPFSPNTFTFFAFVLALPACWAIAQQQYLLAILFILLSGFIDLVDGCLARALNQTSRFGSYFDAMIDRYVDCVLYFGFFLNGFQLEAFLATVGTVLTSYAKPRTAIADQMYAQDWPTIGERTERFILILAGLLLATRWPQIAGVSTIGAMLWLTAGMTHIGAIQRVVYTRRLLHKAEADRTDS
jgi:archaetidylinositol phosphate synthase